MPAVDDIDTLIEDLGHAELRARLEAQRKLATCGAEAVPPLLRLLEGGSLKQRTAAISVLAEIRDPAALEPLIQMLRGPHPLLRMSAAKALADFNQPGVIEALLSALDDDDELVQTWVVESLTALRNSRAVEPLIALLNSTPSPEIRYMVIRALGELGDKRAVEPIRRFENDENRHVKRDVQRALEMLTRSDQVMKD